MFKNLVASEGKKRRVASSKTIFISVLAHSLVLGGAVYAGVVAPKQEEKKQEQVTFVDLKEAEPEPPKVEEPPPPPEPETPKPVDTPPPPPKGFQDLVPPSEPPPVIPDVDPNAQAVKAEDFSGVGTRGGASTGVQGGTPTNIVPKDTTPVFTVEETGGKTELRNQREVIRALERAFPRAYADAGVAGQAMLRFMIDEEGKVPPSSITVITATNDAFGEAAKKVAEKFQFKPIKYRGSFVRVWATMPINFQPPS